MGEAKLIPLIGHVGTGKLKLMAELRIYLHHTLEDAPGDMPLFEELKKDAAAALLPPLS